MRSIFTNSATEVEAGKHQTWYGNDINAKLEDFLPATYTEGKLAQRRFKYIADMFLTGEKKKVLEIGAGSGDLSVYYAQLYPQHDYTISDVSEDLVKRFFPRVKGWFGSRHAFALAYFPVENITLPGESFDVVFMKSTVHHFDDHAKAFAEIRRILRPGGKVVFMNDPICYNIPIYREFRNLTFAFKHRLNGSNCRIYPFALYLACGKGFSKAEWEYDSASMEDIRNNTSRSGWKKYFFSKIRKNPTLFSWFFAQRFNSYIFYFTK